MSLNFHIVNFVAVFFFYSLTVLISYSFTQSLILTQSLSIISKTVLFLIYYVVMIMTLISHYKTMKADNSVENNADYELYYAYLQRLMKNPYSQFYFDLARNEHAMGTTSLHNRINNAYLERNKEHINKNVEYEIFGYDKDGDIYERSLDLAEYLFEKNQKKNKRR